MDNFRLEIKLDKGVNLEMSLLDSLSIYNFFNHKFNYIIILT